MQALTRFKEHTGSRVLYLWLTGQLGGSWVALLSYVLGDEKEGELGDGVGRYADVSVSLSGPPDECNLSSLLLSELELHGLSSRGITARTLSTSPLGAQDAEYMIGVICFDGTMLNSNANALAAEVSLLASQFRIVRLARISEAVLRVQNALAKADERIEPTIAQLGELLAEELGARGFAFRNLNTHADWRRSIPNRDGSKNRFVTLNASTPIPTTQLHSSRRSEVFVGEFAGYHEKAEHYHALVVPLWQDSRVLRKLPFQGVDSFRSSLSTVRTSDVQLMFFDKHVPEYLQHHFSETDQQLAEHVFGYVEQYTERKISDENYSFIHTTLDHFDISGKDTSGEIYNVVRKLSIRFSNVHHLQLDYTGPSFKLSTSSYNDSSQLSDDYVNRIKNSYLPSRLKSDADPDALWVGVDQMNGSYLLEFHLPSFGPQSDVFLLQYSGSTLTSSILESCLLLFGELHLKYRRQFIEYDRLLYPAQVRHAVIHHFSAAAKGMASLRPLWEKGTKRRDYWESIRTNPVVKKQITRSISSLSQAQLIMDNSRFLLGFLSGELRQLNKKGYQIKTLVANCLSALTDLREEKALRINSRSRGVEPNLMTGDATILQVAIMNLFDNAYKYSAYSDIVSWQLEYTRDDYLFSITTSGPEISPDQFQLYLRVGIRGFQRDRLNPRHGTGLGLPVANEILLAHAPSAGLRHVSATHNPDFGGPTNTFYFRMPYLTGISSRGEEK